MDFLADALALGEAEAGKLPLPSLSPSLAALDTLDVGCLLGREKEKLGSEKEKLGREKEKQGREKEKQGTEEEMQGTEEEETVGMMSEELLLEWEAPGSSSLEERLEAEDSPPFHGFGGKLPDKLDIIETPEEIKVVRKKRRGKPRGLHLDQKKSEETVTERRRPSLPEPKWSKPQPAGPAPAPAPTPAPIPAPAPTPAPIQVQLLLYLQDPPLPSLLQRLKLAELARDQ